MSKAIDSFIENPGDNQQQAKAIYKRRQNLKSLVPVGQIGVGRPFAHVESHCCQRQCHRIGQHVPGVSQ